jgi:hypothetical protein
VDTRRCDGGERLALAGCHLGELAVVQHEPGEDLHVERPHREDAIRGFTYERERLAHGGVGRPFAAAHLGEQRPCALMQRVVKNRAQVLAVPLDRANLRLVGLGGPPDDRPAA